MTSKKIVVEVQIFVVGEVSYQNVENFSYFHPLGVIFIEVGN